MSDKGYADDELLSLSGIQHFRFYKRQWALIHIERQWEDNLRTAEGHVVHERVDDPFFNESRGDTVVSRSFPLVSRRLGFFGIADVVEYCRTETGISLPGREGFWTPMPVEYKRGKPKVDERDEVQLCAQVMCLEEMFNIRLARADFYYDEIRRRVSLAITDELRTIVQGLSVEMHMLFSKGVTPAAERGRNCRSCSLVDVCLPNLTKKRNPVGSYVTRHVQDACVKDV